jgi:hypothetical protein
VSELIDLDARPDVSIELEARVEADAAGEGAIVPLAGARWKRELRRLIGKSIRVSLIRWKKRSVRANRYYWGGVLGTLLEKLRELALDRGETCPFESDEALHEAMKHRFLGVKVVEFLGETIEQPPSSARLSSAEFSAYIELIAAWAASIGIYIPQPHEWEAAA